MATPILDLAILLMVNVMFLGLLTPNLTEPETNFFAQFSMLYQTYNVDIEKVDKIIIGSVVPQLTHIISSALYKIHGIEAIVVDRKTHSPIHHKSNQMGTDIFANLVAAHFLYPNKKENYFRFRNCAYCKLCSRRWRSFGRNHRSRNYHFS